MMINTIISRPRGESKLGLPPHPAALHRKSPAGTAASKEIAGISTFFAQQCLLFMLQYQQIRCFRSHSIHRRIRSSLSPEESTLLGLGISPTQQTSGSQGGSFMEDTGRCQKHRREPFQPPDQQEYRKRQLQQRSRQKGTATQERWLFPFSCKRKVTAKKDGEKTPRETNPHWAP